MKINKVALRGMGYSGAMYALDPADPVKDGFSWVETHFTPRSAGPTTAGPSHRFSCGGGASICEREMTIRAPKKNADSVKDYLAGCDDRPRNRPRGAPRRAVPAFSGWAFLILVVPIGITLEIAAYFDNFGIYYHNAQWLFLGVMPVFMSTLILMGQGKLLGVRLFNIESWLLIAAYIPMTVAAIALALGVVPGCKYGVEHEASLQVAFVCVIVGAVCTVLILHGLRHVRWLDPKSLPHEWEISSRSDPASKMFCDQPLDPAQEAQLRWDKRHGIVAPTVRYDPFPNMKPGLKPPSFLLALIAPPLAQLRLGQRRMALLAGILCAGALFFLLFEPWRAVPFWILAAAPAATSASIARSLKTDD